ncbi:MAG: OmpA family protein [Rikenellaceae bacterium]|nr:OmpA family protein [Rikenellaceae bacterium]
MKKVLLTLALVFASTALFAADKNTESEKSYGPYVTNGFWDNWYINLGAGVNTWGRVDVKNDAVSDKHYKNKVTWMIEGSVGKWITPIFGARLHGQGTYGMTSVSNEKGAFYNTNVDTYSWGQYGHKIGYGLIDVDGMVNLSNWIGGYREDRVYNAVGIAGVGVAFARGRNDANGDWSTNAEFAMSFGLNNVFRVCEQVDINLELKAAMMRQDFMGEGKVGMVGVIPSITAGVAYKFKQRNFSTASAFAAAAVAAAAAEVAPYQDRIKDLENELANANDRADKLAGDLANANKDLKDCKENACKRPKGYGANGANLESGVSYTVFFPINKANITKKDMVNLGYVADEINANPGQKYTICGYADKQTGTAAYNMTLSQKRADNVKKVLVEKFGCNADQIEAIGYGDTVDKYGAQILNRAAYVN